jgi:hypothetical protein
MLFILLFNTLHATIMMTPPGCQAGKKMPLSDAAASQFLPNHDEIT